jgi:hypothetical protein
LRETTEVRACNVVSEDLAISELVVSDIGHP